MANRDEIRADFEELYKDKVVLDRLFASADKQSELAKNLNLNSKENEVTEVAEEAVQEAATPELVEDLAKALIPILKELKALREEVEGLKSGTIKAIGDSPKVTLESMVAKYLEQGTVQSEVGKPSVSQFNTPVHAKSAPTDIFSAIDAGVFNKSREQ